MSNTLTIDQSSALLKQIMMQATGQSEMEGMDTSAVLTIAQKMLSTGFDPVMSAISQVISRTVFSSRAYERKFRGLQRDDLSYGNIVRKITILEDSTDLQDNAYIPLDDGTSVDQYTIKKPKALQLNFLGQQTFEIQKTIFDNQLDVAFSNADEVGRFLAAVFTEVRNKIEAVHENTARATVAGFMAGKIAGDTSNVIHLLTEYNAATGKTLTTANMFAPENVEDLMRWIFARVADISGLMTNRSINFHTNLENGIIMRHTPKSEQLCYLFAPYIHQINARVLSTTFHEQLLTLPGYEEVDFWQNIDEPDTINVKTPKYLASDGTIATAGSDVTKSHVFGIIADREALGYSPILERNRTTPMNARGEYYNMFWKFNERYWMDYTENAVVLLLD